MRRVHPPVSAFETQAALFSTGNPNSVAWPSAIAVRLHLCVCVCVCVCASDAQTFGCAWRGCADQTSTLGIIIYRGVSDSTAPPRNRRMIFDRSSSTTTTQLGIELYPPGFAKMITSNFRFSFSICLCFFITVQNITRFCFTNNAEDLRAPSL